MRYGVLALGVAMLMPGAAGAQAGAESESSARVLSGLRACQGLADAERLACYDRAAAALNAAVAAKEVTVLDKQEVRRTRRGLFGFTLPKIGLFAGDSDAPGKEDFTEITTTVGSVRAVANSRVEFTLADESGAVWRTTDPMSFPPKPGQSVRIQKGALGNYFIRFDNARNVRGMRVR